MNEKLSAIENSSNAAVDQLEDQNLIYNRTVINNITLGGVMLISMIFFRKLK